VLGWVNKMMVGFQKMDPYPRPVYDRCR